MVACVQPITDTDVPAAQALLARAYRWPADGPEVRAWRRLRAHEGFATTLGAFQSGDLIGYVDYDPIPILVANTTVAGAVAANMAVDPAWRHRRIATRLMNAQLAQLRDHGIALVTGSAAHVPFMRNLGWEFASTVLRYELAAGDLADQLQHAPASGTAEPLRASDLPDIRTIYDQCVRGRFGSFARTTAWWQLRLLTDPKRHHPCDLTGWKSTEDRIEGYAVIEEHPHVTRVVELHALTRDAYLGLLRHLARSRDATTTLRWSAPADDPLPLLVGDPYRLKPRLEPDKMFRAVQVDVILTAVLGARCDNTALTVAVTDDSAPWNTRTWQVAAGAYGRATATPVDATAETTLTVGTLIALIGGLPAAPAIPRHTSDRTAELAAVLRPDVCAYVREDI